MGISKRSLSTLLSALLLCATSFLSLVASEAAASATGLANSPWPKFQNNDGNTGWSSSRSILSPYIKWTFTTGDYIRSSPVIASDGTIYLGSEDGYLYAINPDGSESWSYATVGEINEGAPAIASDGTIYVGSIYSTTTGYGGQLHALYPDGTLKWELDLGTSGYDSLSPTIAGDGTIYVGADGLYAISPDSSVKWVYPTGLINTTPALANDGTIYALSTDGGLYAVSASGDLVWRFETGSPEPWALASSPSIGADGTIYFGTTGDNKIFAVGSDGSLRWTYQANHIIRRSPSIARDGTVYVGEDAYQGPEPEPGYNFYAIRADGTLKWSYEPRSTIGSSASVAADGTIYITSYQRVYALSARGEIKWELPIGGGVYGSSPAIAEDGTIYVGSYDNKLYAIGGRLGSPSHPPHDSTSMVEVDKGQYLLGEPVLLTGDGFVEGPVDVAVLTPEQHVIAVPSVKADSSGHFERIFYPPRFLPGLTEYVPGLEPGRYRLSATDGTSTAFAVYTVTSEPGQDVGRIILVKQTMPNNAAELFSFKVSYGQLIAYPDGLLMEDDALLDSGYVLTPGTYTIEEYNLPQGWELAHIDVQSKNRTESVDGSIVTINLVAGETVTVTYTNILTE